MGEVEEVLEGLYTQKEEIKVSKVMHKVLLQSEQVVVKPNILDLDDYDVKMEPKATQSDEDIINELCGDQSLYQDDQLDDGHDDIELDLDDLKEEPGQAELIRGTTEVVKATSKLIVCLKERQTATEK